MRESKVGLMKTILIAAMILVCATGQSIAGPKTYIGLYSAGDHNNCRVDVPAVFVSFVVWIWVLPNDDGMTCVEFGVDYPEHYMQVGTTLNPDHSIAIPGCSLPGECLMCFAECRTDWVWIAQMTVLPVEIHQDYISLTSTYGYYGGRFDAASCEPGYPVIPLTILNNLAVNQPCLISTGSSSWGMIKTMFKE